MEVGRLWFGGFGFPTSVKHGGDLRHSLLPARGRGWLGSWPTIVNEASRWPLALRAAALLAIDPIGLGGAVLRAPAGSVREAWLQAFRSANPEMLWRRMPPGVGEGRLLGGLDLSATLAAGRPVAERGLLADVNGGTLIVPMAERLSDGIAAHLCTTLDTGAIVVERDGIAARMAARICCVLLDEGIGDEHAPSALADRLAFRLDLGDMRPSAMEEPSIDIELIVAAREIVKTIAVGGEAIAALCAAGLAFGAPSLRMATLALRAAKAAAALAGRDHVTDEDVTLASALVFAPRATTMPAVESEPDNTRDDVQDETTPDQQPQDAPREPELEADAPSNDAQTLTDRVVEATRAAIPAGLLADLGLAAAGTKTQGVTGRAGAARQSAKRGRPAGVRRGLPQQGARLAVVDTLRAAAPWQALRRAQGPASSPNRVLVRREDFRVGRFKQKSETLTLFVVDASGSAALHRLAEVKGAVELILADCYSRRDSVALIAFRGDKAELILPPTRSLVRAKRALAGQAGGGGTPLALAIDAAALVTISAARKGQTPVAVFLTDGKANIGRAGRPGRAEAEVDALAAARVFRTGGCAGLVLDIAPRPGEPARGLASALGARYIPLPFADARMVSQAVLAAAPSSQGNK